MRARTALLVMGASLAVACTSMQSQYAVRRSNLSCDQANRYAFQSMKSLGYTVTTFEPAAVGRSGTLRGNKTEEVGSRSSSHDGVVHIQCEASEVRLDAAEEQFLSQDLTFTRGFYLAFTGIADHASTGRMTGMRSWTGAMRSLAAVVITVHECRIPAAGFARSRQVSHRPANATSLPRGGSAVGVGALRSGGLRALAGRRRYLAGKRQATRRLARCGGTRIAASHPTATSVT